jgi:hypothetical protein
MAKFQIDYMMDAAFVWFQQTVTRVSIATAQPTNYTDWGTYSVGTLAIASANFTIGNGDTSGRKVTTTTPATITVGTSGTVNHIAFVGTSGSGTLLFVGTCAPTSVTASGTVILSAWDLDEITDVA